MTPREFELVGFVRQANEQLIMLGCPVGQLAVARPAKNRSSLWNFWANAREGFLRKLVLLRDSRK
jgi:hypothetical protein